jgi:parallel beta-helix repeat protein
MRGIILVILILIVGSASAAKIIVEPAGVKIMAIQSAINNANAGDIIEVHSGTYAEHVYLNEAMTLIGVDTGNGRPVIDAKKSGSALTIAANGSKVQGFNFTGSGHCVCGNAGIEVQSSNNTIINNILYKNKYGIYIKSQSVNNTIIANDFLNNEISASDQGNNLWYGSLKVQGLQSLKELIFGKNKKGNHYSDYENPKQGCNDTNHDGVCDLPKKINGGKSIDLYPAIAKENP